MMVSGIHAVWMDRNGKERQEEEEADVVSSLPCPGNDPKVIFQSHSPAHLLPLLLLWEKNEIHHQLIHKYDQKPGPEKPEEKIVKAVKNGQSGGCHSDIQAAVLRKKKSHWSLHPRNVIFGVTFQSAPHFGSQRWMDCIRFLKMILLLVLIIWYFFSTYIDLK